MHGDTIVKVTPNQVREIIKEELENFLAEKKEEYVVDDFKTKESAEAFIKKEGDASMKVRKKGDKYQVITHDPTSA